jgi:trk system potassium uptake protein TrkA
MRPDRPTGRTEATHYVLGGGQVGVAVARRLLDDGHAVRLVDEDYDDHEIPGYHGDPADLGVLEAAGIAGTSTVVVATQSDRRNLLVAQLVRAHFDVARIVVLVNSPCRSALFEAAGHEPICATTALSEALTKSV